MNSKLRCKFCKEYFPRSQIEYGFCSEECKAGKARQKPRKAVVKKSPSRSTFTPEIKQQIRERDGNRCRWCQRGGIPLEVHHICYRSAGGPDDLPWNLIALCRDHHAQAHANGPLWQPILIWTVNFTDLPVPAAKRLYNGLPSGPWDAFPCIKRFVNDEAA